MLWLIHWATVRGLVAPGFKYHFDDINGSTNLNRQKYPVLVYSFIITETRVVFKQDADAKNTFKSTKIHFPPHILSGSFIPIIYVLMHVAMFPSTALFEI